MVRSLALALGSFMLVLATGCGSIHVVDEAQRGGTLALHGPEGAAREKAEQYIRTRCPQGWEIVEEGDAATVGGDGREWRIVYACKGSGDRKSAILAI